MSLNIEDPNPESLNIKDHPEPGILNNEDPDPKILNI